MAAIPLSSSDDSPIMADDAGHLPAPVRPRSRLVRASLLVAGVTIFALLLLTRTELFFEFEAAARDAQARLLPPRHSDRVVVVEIDETDYDSLFSGTSPLAPPVVQQIISAILVGQPRALGVDLETSHPSYRAMTLLPGNAPLVWAREAVPCESSVADNAHGAATACAHGELQALDYAGGTNDKTYGLVAFPFDHDGTIRRYQRMIETTLGPMPSLTLALTMPAGALMSDRHPDVTPLSIDFRRGEPLRVSARTLLAWAADSASEYRTNGVLSGRIVLLGGRYRAARDEYPTPLGLLSGVMIIAQAVETELEGGGRAAPAPMLLLIVQSLTVLVLVATFVRFAFPAAFLITLLVIPVLALLGGWLTTGVAFTGFAYFLPLLIVMLVHILYEKVIEYREALMADLVHVARGGVGRGHLPMDRVEAGLGSVVHGARGWLRRPKGNSDASKSTPTNEG